MEEKINYREKLFYKPKNGYELIDTAEIAVMETYCDGYKAFLNEGRTERECVKLSIEIAENEGYREYKLGDDIKVGDKIYFNNRGKSIMLANIGEVSPKDGVLISAAHIDSPKLDLKQNPLYEAEELAFFKTHYYGGIKKYQWTAVPLELHGVVALKDGSVIDVVIGRDKSDPQFVITDLLPHLAQDQFQKTLGKAITGEGLNILIGSVPYADDGKDRTKLAIMSILHDTYGIVEEDFISAELTAVPAYDVRDLGLDRSIIGGYGHDDRVCAYASLRAMLDAKSQKTTVTVLADKEETGSDGISGMKSEVFELFMGEICKAFSVDLRECFSKSICISSDVTVALDPNYPEVTEKQNTAKLNYGIGLAKFTGARGKSDTSDAPAELVALLRNVFEKNNVAWQMCELGKVDQGGGGTVAMYMANRNIATIDAGVPVLSMHAPFEQVAKFDCYMTYKALVGVFEM